jgi:hypothetical protein
VATNEKKAAVGADVLAAARQRTEQAMPSDEQLDASSQETTLIVWLQPDSGKTMCVDSICEQLLTEFPGAVVTAQNSFEARRLRLEDLRKYSQERLRQGTLEPWSWKTMDELNEGIDMRIRHIRRAELTWGPQKDLAIPLGIGTQLEGHVGAKSLQFRGHCRRTDVTVANLVRLLESLNIGKVEILDHDPNRVASTE